MLDMAGYTIETESLDHHGLIASACRDLRIAERIDEKFPKEAKARKVSPGKAVESMIINGLGFSNRRVYLTHQFYQNKPVERLLGPNYSSTDITAYTLSNTLDLLFQYGVTQLFGEIAFPAALENKLIGKLYHLDTTSLSVEGAYDINEGKDSIDVTYGHSKDHRPDIKQVVLSMVVNGPSNIPIWMEPLNGNNSDQSSFHASIKQVESFKKAIDLDDDSRWVADSALYTKGKLLREENRYIWVTRVPEKIKAARHFVETPNSSLSWQEQSKGYKTFSKDTNHGGIKQRWLLVYSEQAFNREKKTLEKKLQKQEDKLKKALWHLSNQIFSSEEEIKRAIKPLRKAFKFFLINEKVQSIYKYTKPGKPSPGDKKQLQGYQVEASFILNKEKYNQTLNTKGRFIIATNDLDKENYTDDLILLDYKKQQSVERGFLFLKDPWFMVDSIFLKLPSRIESLMMVMTLCLFVYNYTQYKLRENLLENKASIPNQLGVATSKPTLRWVFQLMEGVGVVKILEDDTASPVKELITNLNDVRKKIITLLGKTTCEMYGLDKVEEPYNTS